MFLQSHFCDQALQSPLEVLPQQFLADGLVWLEWRFRFCCAFALICMTGQLPPSWLLGHRTSVTIAKCSSQLPVGQV